MKLSYSQIYALIFGLISAIAALLMYSLAMKEDWKYLWIYIGLGSTMVAFTLSYFLLEKNDSASNTRRVVVGTLIALLSHWFSWYLLIVVSYIKWEFFGYDASFEPCGPLSGLLGAVGLTFFSLVFFGWTSIPISIYLAFRIMQKE